MGKKITLNSAYRSTAQQYLLWSMKKRGTCGIKAAAPPGKSNHEGGLGIDVPKLNVDSWKPALEAKGFKWFGKRDKVHFDYLGAGADTNANSKSLKAFQTLWNSNNPSDTIAVDGRWGSQTKARLEKTKCRGWLATNTKKSTPF